MPHKHLHAPGATVTTVHNSAGKAAGCSVVRDVDELSLFLLYAQPLLPQLHGCCCFVSPAAECAVAPALLLVIMLVLV